MLTKCRKHCCAAIKSLFTNEGKHSGEATVEAVRHIANLVKIKNCILHSDSIEVSLPRMSYDNIFCLQIAKFWQLYLLAVLPHFIMYNKFRLSSELNYSTIREQANFPWPCCLVLDFRV